jgi:hypothetical protein
MTPLSVAAAPSGRLYFGSGLVSAASPYSSYGLGSAPVQKTIPPTICHCQHCANIIFWTTAVAGPVKSGAAICALMSTRPRTFHMNDLKKEFNDVVEFQYDGKTRSRGLVPN